jgi:hypothetical protein
MCSDEPLVNDRPAGRPRFTTSRLTWCSGVCVLPVMDDEAELFMFEIAHDPWAAITEPLPESLYDLDALKRLRPIV